MKKFEHWKTGTIYELYGQSVSAVNRESLEKVMTDKELVAYHHDTQQPLTFVMLNVEGYFLSPDEESYILYVAEGTGKVWAREHDDFFGEKELPDGEKVRRFKPLFDEKEKYERPKADIQFPGEYVLSVERALKTYKKFLKENNRLQDVADTVETDEERAEALRKVTEHFKSRYAGVIAKDMGDRLSVSQIQKIWDKFIRNEYRPFLNAHLNLTMTQIVEIGIDKFVYVMGWRRPSDVATWRNNKLRVGACCHCKDQFIPMMLQHNHGLCSNCRHEYSSTAIRKFIIKQLNVAKRYEGAQRDLLMDFYIMFYHDDAFRRLFKTGSKSAIEMESFEDELPEWVNPTNQQGTTPQEVTADGQEQS